MTLDKIIFIFGESIWFSFEWLFRCPYSWIFLHLAIVHFLLNCYLSNFCLHFLYLLFYLFVCCMALSLSLFPFALFLIHIYILLFLICLLLTLVQFFLSLFCLPISFFKFLPSFIEGLNCHKISFQSRVQFHKL